MKQSLKHTANDAYEKLIKNNLVFVLFDNLIILKKIENHTLVMNM